MEEKTYVRPSMFISGGCDYMGERVDPAGQAIRGTEKSASVVNTGKIDKSYPISNGAAEKSNADCPGSVTGWVKRGKDIQAG